MPRSVALYFKAEDTTGIAPTSVILTGRVESGSEIQCQWDGEEVTATIIALSSKFIFISRGIFVNAYFSRV